MANRFSCSKQRKTALFSLLLASSLLAAATVVFAEEEGQGDSNFDGAKFDGSDFNASDFGDRDFRKKEYKELPGANREKKFVERGERAEVVTRRKENDIMAGQGRQEEEGNGERKAFVKEEEYGAISDLAGDWVPDTIHVDSNGGFSIAPFNGSPVPYHLNGHVDPQRGKP